MVREGFSEGMNRILNGNSWEREAEEQMSTSENMLRYSGKSREAAQAEEENAYGELVGEDGVELVSHDKWHGLYSTGIKYLYLWKDTEKF